MRLGYLVESNGYSPEVFTDWDVLLNYLKKVKTASNCNTIDYKIVRFDGQ